MPPIVLVHGFTQTAASWAPLVPLLAPAAGDGAIVTVDVPGHGARAEEGRLGLWAAAEHLADSLGERPAVWIGYSLGGRLALHVALLRPARVASLVLVGATPGLRDPAARSERRALDEERARDLETRGVAAFLTDWLAQPLFATLPAGFADRAGRLTNTVEGLAASLRHAGTGAQDDLWPRLHELAMPVLCVAGESDAKFAAIARAMATAIGPHASVELLPDAGHAAHLEQPEAFTAVVTGFLRQHS